MPGKQIKHNSTHVAKVDTAIADLSDEARAEMAVKIRNGGVGDVNAAYAFARTYENLPDQLKNYALFQLENYVEPEVETADEG